MTGKKLYTIRVTGIVQGVFYRKTTQQKALELGLEGLVQNKRDGSVYIEAQGEESALQELLEWCRHGPPRAEVETVSYEEGTTRDFETFTVEK